MSREPNRKPQPRLTPGHGRYDDVKPPADWQPKSDYFKAIWRHAEESYAKEQFNLRNPRLTLICPCCDKEIVVRLSPLPRAEEPGAA